MILNLCDYPFTLNNKPYSVAFFIHWLLCVRVCVCVCVCVSCSVMSDSMRPPSFSVHGILQARILEWIAMPSSRGSSPLRDWTQVLCITGGLHHLMEKAMATHSSTLAWKIPWTEEPGGSQRVGHDRATSLSLFTFMHWRRKWQPTPVFLPGESQGRQSLVGCRLWGCSELLWSDLAAAATIWATREASGCFGQCFIIQLWNKL